MRKTIAQRLDDINYFALPHRVVGGYAIPTLEQVPTGLESVGRLAVDNPDGQRCVDEVVIPYGVNNFHLICPIRGDDGGNPVYHSGFSNYSSDHGGDLSPEYFEDAVTNLRKTEVHAIYNPPERSTHFFMVPSRLALGELTRTEQGECD